MPAGSALIRSVFERLKTHEAQTPQQVRARLAEDGIHVSERSLRYALKALLDAGRASRNEVRYGDNRRFYRAVAPQQVAA